MNTKRQLARKKEQAASPALTPPNSVESEKALLGILLIRPELHDLCSLPEEAWYWDRHRAIWVAMRSLLDEGTTPEHLAVAARLKPQEKMFPGGPLLYLSEMADVIATTADWATWRATIEDRWNLRRLSRISFEISQMTSSCQPAKTCIEEAERLVMELRSDEATEIMDARGAIGSAMSWMEGQLSSDTEAAPSLGLPSVDEKLKLMPKRLTILAARPRIGKTALALNIMAEWSRAGARVLFVSMEMTRDELMLRLLSSASRVDLQGILDRRDAANASLSRVALAAEEMKRWPMLIDDSGRLDLSTLTARARQAVSKRGGLDLIIIDYLQLMKGEGRGGERQNEVEDISRGLKALAKELNVHVLALAQLNRELEKRKDPVPKLSDLRDSGSLEQDADAVMLLHRADLEEGELSQEGTLTVAKNRHGKQGRVSIRFDGPTQTFSEGW